MGAILCKLLCKFGKHDFCTNEHILATNGIKISSERFQELKNANLHNDHNWDEERKCEDAHQYNEVTTHCTTVGYTNMGQKTQPQKHKEHRQKQLDILAKPENDLKDRIQKHEIKCNLLESSNITEISNLALDSRYREIVDKLGKKYKLKTEKQRAINSLKKKIEQNK